MQAYLLEFGRVLKDTGTGFIHHSNLGGRPDPVSVEPSHLHAPSMSAQAFRTFIEEAGLSCRNQEIINWGGNDLIDCLTLFTGSASDFKTKEPTITKNRRFMEEAVYLAGLHQQYSARANEQLD